MDPWKAMKIYESEVVEKEARAITDMKQRQRNRANIAAWDAGLPTPPLSEYTVTEWSVITEDKHLLQPKRSMSDPNIVVDGMRTFKRMGPDRDVKIMPSPTGLMQHNKYQNNIAYIKNLPNLSQQERDFQDPPRNEEGKDPFGPTAEGAHGFLVRYPRPPPELPPGTWRMNRGRWYMDNEGPAWRPPINQTRSFDQMLEEYRGLTFSSRKDVRRSKQIKGRARTYEPRNPVGGWYAQRTGCI